jgi:hypothetical protein
MRMGLESNLDVGVLVYLKRLWFRGGSKLFDVVRIGFSGQSALILFTPFIVLSPFPLFLFDLLHMQIG